MPPVKPSPLAGVQPENVALMSTSLATSSADGDRLKRSLSIDSGFEHSTLPCDRRVTSNVSSRTSNGAKSGGSFSVRVSDLICCGTSHSLYHSSNANAGESGRLNVSSTAVGNSSRRRNSSGKGRAKASLLCFAKTILLPLICILCIACAGFTTWRLVQLEARTVSLELKWRRLARLTPTFLERIAESQMVSADTAEILDERSTDEPMFH